MAGRSHDPRVPPEHGSASMYERYECRCKVCVAAHTVKVREYRARRRDRAAS